MILGKNLIVSINGTPIAAAKSCTVSVSQDFIQACSPTEGRVMTKLPSTYDWSMSVNGLIANSTLPNSLVTLLIAGTQVLINFTDGSNQKYAGYAYVKSCEEGGSIGNLATFSASFESTGPLYTQYSSPTTAAFTEGEEIGFTIVDNLPDYEQDRHYNIYGVEVTVTKRAVLNIFADNNFVVYKASFADVKQAIGIGTTSGLEQYIVVVGSSEEFTIDLAPGTYTILENIYYTEQSELTAKLWQTL